MAPRATPLWSWILAVCCLSLHAIPELCGTSSSSIVLTPDEKTVCLVNQDSGTISLWDWVDSGTLSEIPVGDEPRTLAVSPDSQTLVVTTQRSQELVAVDIEQRKRTSALALGGQPLGVVLSQDGKRAFVSLFAGGYRDGKYSKGLISIVDLKEMKVAQSIPVRAFPYSLALDHTHHRLYVTHYFAHNDLGHISVIDVQSAKLIEEIQLSQDQDVAGGSGGVFTACSSIALHPRLPRALVAGIHANVRRGPSSSGHPLSHKTTMQAVVRVLDLEGSRELPGSRIISSFSGQAVAVPSAVAFLPDAKHFIDVYFVSHDFKLLAYNDAGIVAERTLFELPFGPTGVAITHDGRHAFFNGRWSRSVAHVNIENIRKPTLEREIVVTTEPWKENRIRGARVFHDSRNTRMTPNRWLACGSCHLDGGLLSDNLIWEFTHDQKPSSPSRVNTKALGLTHGSAPPILIQGTYQSVQEEEKFIRSFLQGTGFRDAKSANQGYAGVSTELDSLEAFVMGLRPRPNPHMDGNLPRREILASATRGSSVFRDEEVGCSRCHRGPNLTISGNASPGRLYDVGTGIRADVPSLLSLWSSAPYLHDGRAKSLRDVITTHNSDDRHGSTSHLANEELEDLVNYILAPFASKPN